MQNELKFALLFGNQAVDNKNLDGALECVYIDDNSYHIEYFIEYFKTHFKSDSFLQGVKVSTTAHQVAIYLQELGHITFMNTTSNYSYQTCPIKSGLLILPDTLTDKQLEGLNKLAQEIKDYDNIQVWQHFYKDEDGILSCNSRSNIGTNLDVVSFIDKLVKDERNIKQK